jgi:hypothetical protein
MAYAALKGRVVGIKTTATYTGSEFDIVTTDQYGIGQVTQVMTGSQVGVLSLDYGKSWSNPTAEFMLDSQSYEYIGNGIVVGYSDTGGGSLTAFNVVTGKRIAVDVQALRYSSNPILTVPAVGELVVLTVDMDSYNNNQTDQETVEKLYAWPSPVHLTLRYPLSSLVKVEIVSPCADTTPPTVTFTAPATSTSLTITGIVFTATSSGDPGPVNGYMLTNSSVRPSPNSTDWKATAPNTFVFTTPGDKRLYAWARNEGGNVSSGNNALIKITLPDPVPPATNPKPINDPPPPTSYPPISSDWPEGFEWYPTGHLHEIYLNDIFFTEVGFSIPTWAKILKVTYKSDSRVPGFGSNNDPREVQKLTFTQTAVSSKKIAVCVFDGGAYVAMYRKVPQGYSVDEPGFYGETSAPPTDMVVSDTSVYGRVTAFLSHSIVVTGGVSPYTYEKTGGDLPAGISFANGSFTGTPTAAGSASATYKVTDSTMPLPHQTKTFGVVFNIVA